MDEVAWRAAAEGIMVPVRAKPHGGRDRVLGIRGGALHIAVSAAPEHGKANAALAAVLAAAFAIPRSAVVLQRGAAARDKAFLLVGLSPADFAPRLAAALPRDA